ncbi:MAG: clan AA aspartic protease [Planctomycetaceae bacterium]
MIEGIVNADLEAMIAVTIHGPGGVRAVDALIDTGFNGALSLPSALISDLQLPWRQTGWAVLADDSRILVDLFEASVEWHGAERRVYVDEGCSTALLGMSLLEGSHLRINVVEAGRLAIEELP